MVTINASWGLGELVVKGMVTPDEFCVHKPTLQQGFKPIIKKKLGQKTKKMVYSADQSSLVNIIETSLKEQQHFCLSDEEILALAGMALTIEKHYSELKKSWAPMDIEWAKDGVDGLLYIVQARPETIHNEQKKSELIEYRLQGISHDDLKKRVIVEGQSIGQTIASGTARIIKTIQDPEVNKFKQGDVLVTSMTDPDWLPLMKKAAALITERGGRTSHAAIVSRELGIPAVIGAEHALSSIQHGHMVTVDCSQGQRGFVYDGDVPVETKKINIETLPKLSIELMVNCANPDQVFQQSLLPVDGVGLARIEFIIGSMIKIHPMAAVMPEKITDAQCKKQIEQITSAYPDAKTFFCDLLAQGVGMIAAAFYPRPVIVRFSDFKSNEYRNLLGGTYFEPVEENPMLGLRGASRYYSPLYEGAFALECAAMKKVLSEMGLRNVKLMIPFVRTTQEAQEVVERMKKHGLVRGKDGLELYMMCELPSNVLLIDEFSNFFDGFSIGSNDLTQTTLAVDRDSALLAPLFNEHDPAVKKMIEMAIRGAQHNKKHSGICGQAPSDYPDIADFVIKLGINSVSLNADSVIPFLLRNATNKK